MYATCARCVAHAAGRSPARHSFPSVSSFPRLLSIRHATFATRAHRLLNLPLERDDGTPGGRRHRRHGRHGRHYATAADGAKMHAGPRSIAVLGGGLTGLTTAWYLTRALPHARITIYEASDRLGGWIDTKRTTMSGVNGGEKGTVHFERAARMVKPQTRGRITKWDDLVFFDLVSKLGLTDQLMHSPKSEEDVAGFIYHQEAGLVPIPIPTFEPFKHPIDSFKSLLAVVRLLLSPPFRGFFPSCWGLSYRRITGRAARDESSRRGDISVGDYFANLFGTPALVDQVMSALVHGVTGGDIYKLSMKSGPFSDVLVSTAEQPVTQALVRCSDYELMRDLMKDKAVNDLASQHLSSGALWFRRGFDTLTNTLAKALKNNPNVTISTGDPVTSIRYLDEFDRVYVASKKKKQPVPYEKVVSTMYAKTLASITDDRLPSLAASTATTIMIVNLWHPLPFANAPYRGFGYLLPQSIPYADNPECVLGVIFDSDREFYPRIGADVSSPAAQHALTMPDVHNRGADTVLGTKLTVMLGGHYWDDLPPQHIPTKAEAIDLAKRAVQRHLRHLHLDPSIFNNAAGSAKLCRDCIPQHTVGHADRMRAAHGELEWGFKGRLAVAGQSYTSPGVLGALRAGRDVATQIAASAAKKRETPGSAAAAPAPAPAEDWSVGDTGLERFTKKTRYLSLERVALPLKYGSRAYVDEEGNVQSGRLGRGKDDE